MNVFTHSISPNTLDEITYHGFIYVIENKINGKIYVGQKNFDFPRRRWRWYLGSGEMLKRAKLKYGKENFKLYILELCHQENIDDCETHWIKTLDARNHKIGYNLCDGGGTVTGMVHSKESRQKISDSLIGNKFALGMKHTDEARKKMSEAHKGNKHFLGKTHTDEAKQKIGESCRGDKHYNAKTLYRMDSDHNILETYIGCISQSDGRRLKEQGYSETSIRTYQMRYIRDDGTFKYKGFIWKRKEEV